VTNTLAGSLAELPALDAAPAQLKECLNRFVAKVDDAEYIKKLSDAFGLNVKNVAKF
jgi:hypothetical protein